SRRSRRRSRRRAWCSRRSIGSDHRACGCVMILLQARRMGTAFAALLNGRARRVTPAVVRALRHALPDSTILVSQDIDQARRHVRELIRQRPDVVLSGGGDGAVVRLLNLWREGGGRELPVVGLLRLGTGNGWARGVGTPKFFAHLPRLARLNGEALPVQEFTLVEGDDHLCPFAGVGWGARILHDYPPNMAKRTWHR